MANWLLPTNTSDYATVLFELKDRDTDLAKQFADFSGTTSDLPLNTIKWDPTNKKDYKWNGTAWIDKTDIYNIDISGSASTITTTLPTTKGGTGNNSALVQYGVVFANSTSSQSTTSAGTTGYPLLANTTSGPQFGALNLSLSGATSGTLSVSKGGTGGDSVVTARAALDVPSRNGTNATGNWGIDISGNANTANTAASAATAGAIANSGGWGITPTGNTLILSYNGTSVGSLDSSGNLTVIGNVTAYGTI